MKNYEKRNYKELGFASFPNWHDTKEGMKSDFCIKTHQTSQEVLNTPQQAWKSFFKLKATGGVVNPNRQDLSTWYCFKYLNNGLLLDLIQDFLFLNN